MINVSELESSVKKGLKAAYFIKGDDLYLVDYSKSVLKSLVTDGADEEFAVEVFEDFSEPDEILAVLDTPSFFSELKLVLVKVFRCLVTVQLPVHHFLLHLPEQNSSEQRVIPSFCLLIWENFQREHMQHSTLQWIHE